MNRVFETLQDRYHDLVAQTLTGATDTAFLESVRIFLSDARQAGAAVTAPEERSLLRAYIRFLAGVLHRAGQEMPEVDLLPPDRERWPVGSPASRRGPVAPAWVWGLVGAAALVVLAGLVAVAAASVGGMLLHPTPVPSPSPTLPPPSTPTPTSTPVPSPVPSPTPTLPPPSFSGLTTCLGVLNPVGPFRPADEFEWHTQAVYAVFNYEGMQDGMAWSVVWTRNGQVVERQDAVWDAERDGSAGASWVVHFNSEGTFMWAGNYTVSLYIGDELQAEASFRVRLYQPSAW